MKRANYKKPKDAGSTPEYWKAVSEDVLLSVYKTARAKKLDKMASRAVEKGFAVTDISTKLDDAIGKIVPKHLSDRGISLRLFSEEFGSRVIGKNPKVSASLDELDGTAMAFHGIPTYSTTIAIFDSTTDFHLERVVAAATLRHSDGAIFSAGKGIGTFVNGKRASTSARTTLDDPESLLFLNQQTDSKSFMGVATLLDSRGFKRDIGSSAMHLAYVASGQAEAFVHNEQKLNDLAAGALLIREAGGIVTDFDGNEIKVQIGLKGMIRMVASANPSIHREILERLHRAHD